MNGNEWPVAEFSLYFYAKMCKISNWKWLFLIHVKHAFHQSICTVLVSPMLSGSLNNFTIVLIISICMCKLRCCSFCSYFPSSWFFFFLIEEYRKKKETNAKLHSSSATRASLINLIIRPALCDCYSLLLWKHTKNRSGFTDKNKKTCDRHEVPTETEILFTKCGVVVASWWPECCGAASAVSPALRWMAMPFYWNDRPSLARRPC